MTDEPYWLHSGTLVKEGMMYLQDGMKNMHHHVKDGKKLLKSFEEYLCMI
jgi:hypothetical protein